MAEDGVKVGDAYIDIETDLDTTDLMRTWTNTMRRVQRQAEATYGQGYGAAVRKAIRDSDAQFTASNNRHLTSWQRLQQQKLQSERVANQQRIAMERQVNRERLAAERASARERMATLAHTRRLEILHERDRLVRLRTLDRDVNRRTIGIGDRIGRNLRGGIEGILSLLPSRLEFLFTRTGGVMGTTFMTAFLASVLIGLPALGAILTGAFMASLGFGAAIAAAIVGATKDPRVDAAAKRLSDKFMQKFVFDKRVQHLGAVLAAQLDKVTRALDRWAPHIQNILIAGGKFLPGITNGLIGMVDAFLPALDKLINSPFMKEIMKIAAEGLTMIGEAFGDSFEMFLKDPKAMKGAALALRDLFDIIKGGITTMTQFMLLMSRFWNSLTGKEGGKQSKIEEFKTQWRQIREAIGGGVDFAKQKISEFIGFLEQEGITGLISQWVSTFKTGFETLKVVVGAAGAFIRQIWRMTGEALKGDTHSFFGGIILAARGFFVTLQGLFQILGALIKGDWSKVWEGVRNVFRGIWMQIVGIGRAVWNLIIMGLRNTGAVIRVVWDAIWERARNSARVIWNTIVVFFKTTWNTIFNFLKARWNNIWQVAVMIWQNITTFISRMIGRARDVIILVLNTIRGTWNTRWGQVKDFVAAIWNTIRTNVSTAINWVKDRIAGVLDSISRTWTRVWNGLSNFFGGIWKGIIRHAANGLNGVINLINTAIRTLNGALDKLGIGFKIPTIPFIFGGSAAGAAAAAAALGKRAGGKAGGGRVFGIGSTTSDSIPTWLSRDEYVIRASSARAIGYHNLDMINRHGMKGASGYASGGRVGGGNNALLEQHRNHVHVAMSGPRMSWPQIVRAAKASGLPYSVSSTYRPGSRGSGGGLDHHSEGRAVDFAGYNQDALAGYFERLRGVIELIHRTNKRDYAIFGGKGGGGFLGGIFKWLARGWNWVLDHILKPAGNKAIGLFPENNAMMAFGKGWLSKSWEAIIAKAKAEFEDAKAAMDTGGAYDPGGQGATRWAGIAGTALNMLGLPGSWLGPLLRLIQRESGGNPRAINLWDSNARRGDPSRGLMQTIGSTFRAYALPGFNKNIYDPLSNILAGLRYIRARYGSIFNVQQAVGSSPRGYDSGGILPPGVTTAVNNTGRPEYILTEEQWKSMRLHPTTNVYIDGVKTAHRAVVDENNIELVRDLNRGY